MRYQLYIVGLLVTSFLLLAQFAVCQETITDKDVLSSFAKIIRTKNYICQPCSQVDPIQQNNKGLSYEVSCNRGLTYTVILTPVNAVVVRPLAGF